jgi:hypothetical protein
MSEREKAVEREAKGESKVQYLCMKAAHIENLKRSALNSAKADRLMKKIRGSEKLAATMKINKYT